MKKPGASGKAGQPRRKPVAVKSYSPKTLSKLVAKQRATEKLQRQKRKAFSAVSSFRKRKQDHGKFILVSSTGKRGVSAKGRKGFLVYVSKSGHKSLAIHNKDFTAQKASRITPPAWRNRKAAQEFTAAKLEKISTGRVVRKGSGSVKPDAGAWDFSDKVVNKIVKSLQRVFTNQASHRTFVISVNVLYRIPGTGVQAISFKVDIARPDFLEIKEQGLYNYVRRRFYSVMAQTLSLEDKHGYVTSGSSNHIRSLGINRGKPREQWQMLIRPKNKPEYYAEWKSMYKQVVKIQLIEWQIFQAK